MRPSFNILMVGLMALAFLVILFFNMADVQASYNNCQEIQALKKAQLTTAETSYARFETTLRLLKIEKTKELEDIRDANIKFARENFAPKNCKRFYFPFMDGNGSVSDAPPYSIPPPNKP